METLKIRNAKIRSVSLQFVKGSLLDLSVTLDYGGETQSYGGYVLGNKSKSLGDRCDGFGIDVVMTLLEVIGVDCWEKLVGQPCRAEVGSNGFGMVQRVGNHLKDEWLDLEVLSESYKRLDQS